MIVNDVVTGIIAIIIGYLLGSIPSAYLAARLASGKDIRQLGGGNVGGLKFLPTARAAWTKTETKKDFVFDRWQKNKTK